jgi:hypothetical protein
MREGELERIIEIANLVLRERRPDCWEGKIEMLQKNRPYPLSWRKWVLLQLSDAMGCKRGDMIKSEVDIED